MFRRVGIADECNHRRDTVDVFSGLGSVRLKTAPTVVSNEFVRIPVLANPNRLWASL